jgi:outer membrane protein TolC
VRARYNTQYQAELLEKTSKIRDVAVKQHDAKLLAEIDFLNVESQQNQVMFQVESSQNDALSAEVVLRQVLDLEEKEPMPVEIKLEFNKIGLDFEELLKSSLTNSADIRIKGYIVEAAKYGILVYKGKQKPHFDLRGSYGTLGEAFHDTEAFEDGKADIDVEKEWYLGVHGSMPLGPNSLQYDQIKHVYGPTVLANTGSEDWRHHVEFNLFDRFSAITDEKTAQSALLEAEAEYQRVRNEITLRLRDDYYALQRSVIQVDSSVAKMKYQEKQSKILEYLVSVQEASPATVIENLIENAQDRFSFVQAVTDYNISLSSLSVSIGDPYYFEK